MKKIEGVIPIVLTPLEENGDIDVASCKKLIDYLVAHGASALFILGSASENFSFDMSQRITAIKAMARANAGRLPMIAGCSNIAPRNVFQLMEEVANEQLDGFHYIPYDLKIGDRQLSYMITTYADRSPFPIFLYHNIKRGRQLSFSLVKELREHPKIIGMKVGGYNLSEMINFLTLERDDFQVLGSGGGQFLPWLTFGAKGVTASSACCFPDEFLEMYNLFKSGKFEEAQKKQIWFRNLNKQIPNTNAINGEFAAEEKYILHLKGIMNEFCHFPYRKLTDEEKETVKRLLAEKQLI